MSSDTIKSENNFHDNLKESLKFLLTLAILIFLLIGSFYTLGIVFPTNVVLEIDAFVFAYIMAIPFMISLALYPFAKK